MERKIALTLLFTLSLQIQTVEAKIRPLGRYFKLVPAENAHVVQGSASQKALPSDSIRVLVWNIKKALLSNWKTEFTEYTHGQDLFLIQEAYESPVFVETLENIQNVRWDMGLSFRYALYNNQGTGSMVGSYVQPSSVLVKHTPDTEPGTDTPKTTTFATYPIEGHDEKLLVVSVHGINLTTLCTFKRHMEQIEEVINSHKGPVVFAGDFNTRTKARTNYLNEMVKRLNFTTVNFENGEYRMKFKFTPYYLDHSFVRGLKVKTAEVVKESSGSDHKPMVMELSLNP